MRAIATAPPKTQGQRSLDMKVLQANIVVHQGVWRARLVRDGAAQVNCAAGVTMLVSQG